MRSVLACLLLPLVAAAPAAAASRMPDSPTGRMAEALLELVTSESGAALAAFVGDRLSPSAPVDTLAELQTLQRECAGGEPTAVRKTGPTTAVLTLKLSGGRCEVDYGVEAEAPYRLVGLRLGVLKGGPPPADLDLGLPTGGDDAALAAAVGGKLEEMTAAGEFAGVVLLARGGEPFFHRAYGLADRAAGRANTVETRFDVGSITKLLTRVAIAQLAAAGKLELDATLLSVLPDYPNPDVAGRITVQQLLDHSSGLGDIFNSRWQEADRSRFRDPRDFFPLFADRPLEFDPGSRRAYSNAGFVVLGAVVEKLSGMSYFDYVAARILEPAGMNPDGFPVRDGSDPGVAVGYARSGSAGLEPNLGRLPIRGCPAGSSSHTAADLLALERALRAGRLLDPEWTGWVYTGQRGEGSPQSWSIGVAGGGPGVSAILEADAETTVVVLSNLDPPAAEQLGIALYRALSARQP